MSKTSLESDSQVLVSKVTDLLRDYEQFDLEERVTGDYLIRLRTNTLIHQTHTKRDLFVPNSVYQMFSMSALPSFEFMQEWLKNARQSARKMLESGNYTTEELIHGEPQTVRRKYNRWVYCNRDYTIIGQVQVIDLAKNSKEPK